MWIPICNIRTGTTSVSWILSVIYFTFILLTLTNPNTIVFLRFPLRDTWVSGSDPILVKSGECPDSPRVLAPTLYSPQCTPRFHNHVRYQELTARTAEHCKENHNTRCKSLTRQSRRSSQRAWITAGSFSACDPFLHTSKLHLRLETFDSHIVPSRR